MRSDWKHSWWGLLRRNKVWSEHPAAGLIVARVGGVMVVLAQGSSHGEVEHSVMLGLVPHQHLYSHSLGAQRSQAGRHLPPFGFISPVLEPDFHLGLCELQGSCQIGPFGTREVPLGAEATLQLVDLRVREGRSGALLRGRPALTRLRWAAQMLQLTCCAHLARACTILRLCKHKMRW